MTLREILDRLTPTPLRVSYGPNRGSEEYQALGAHAWHCGRCRDVGGHEATLEGAWTSALAHASGGRWMRVVYEEG